LSKAKKFSSMNFSPFGDTLNQLVRQATVTWSVSYYTTHFSTSLYKMLLLQKCLLQFWWWVTVFRRSMFHATKDMPRIHVMIWNLDLLIDQSMFVYKTWCPSVSPKAGHRRTINLNLKKFRLYQSKLFVWI